MIHDPHHTITALAVIAPSGLSIAFSDGKKFTVNLADTIRAYSSLSALSDPAIFSLAHIDKRGGYVIWIEDDLELAADNLRNIAVEQSGSIGNERILNWMDKNKLTQERAASAIGVSRRMLNYYLSGAKSIPKTVWLACLGWEAIQDKPPRRISSISTGSSV
jgi:hypothetical protein